MSKQLVITEKPSVARDIAQVLGGFVDHAEYFENDQYVITFALGHLLELSEPEDYDKAWRGWTLASLPILPDRFTVKPKEGQKKRLDVIKKLATRKDVGGIINACDAGREGEVIFRRIIEYCELDGRPHHRLWLQSMTAEAIRAGFEHLRPGEDLDHLDLRAVACFHRRAQHLVVLARHEGGCRGGGGRGQRAEQQRHDGEGSLRDAGERARSPLDHQGHCCSPSSWDHRRATIRALFR